MMWLALALVLAPAADATARDIDSEIDLDPNSHLEDVSPPTTTLVQRALSLIDRTDLGGYGETAFATGNDETARFFSSRYALLAHSQIAERVSAAAELAFVWGGTPVKRNGVWRPGEVQVGFSVLDVRVWPGWEIRAGIVLVPVGSLNLHHDGPVQQLTDLPIAYTSIVPGVWSDVGLGVVGSVPLAGAHRVDVEAYVLNGLDSRIADGPGLSNARGSLMEDINRDKAVVARLSLNLEGLTEVGFSGYTGAYDAHGHRILLGNIDAAVRVGSWEILAEVVVAGLDAGYVADFAADASDAPSANTRAVVPRGMWGYYAQVGYAFTIDPLWELLPDDLQEASLMGVLRYESKDTDTNRLTQAGDVRRLTVGLVARPVPACAIKTNLQLETHGVDDSRDAYDLWRAGFWQHNTVRFVGSVAFAF